MATGEQVGAARAAASEEVPGLLRARFARVEPRRQARAYPPWLLGVGESLRDEAQHHHFARG